MKQDKYRLDNLNIFGEDGELLTTFNVNNYTLQWFRDGNLEYKGLQGAKLLLDILCWLQEYHPKLIKFDIKGE